MSDNGFDAFGLPPKLAHALARMKFTTPTPIQEQTIPLALQGRDVLGSAQTGTGKTGAFGIPLIAGLMNRPDAAALVMTPTRELAVQVMAALEPMIPTVDIRTAVLIGGEAMPRQLSQLRAGPRLIVGTPGRINDHLERGSLKLGNVRFLVLDETDRMLDMGFGIQIERILKHVPDERQTMLFSATLPHNITKLSGKYMKDPVRVAVGSTVAPAANLKQEVINVTDSEKYDRLLKELETRKGTVIIFIKTKHGTERMAKRLNGAGLAADAIHGDLQQRRRDRVILQFREKKFRILVATDVAARGLDIPHIAHVINYDMPQAPEDYIHRIGRTARAGAEGSAISFVTPADNQKWRAIERLMRGEDPNAPPQRREGGRGGNGGRGGSGGRNYGPREGGREGSKPGGKPFWKRDGERPRYEERKEHPAASSSRSEVSRSDAPRERHAGNARPESRQDADSAPAHRAHKPGGYEHRRREAPRDGAPKERNHERSHERSAERTERSPERSHTGDRPRYEGRKEHTSAGRSDAPRDRHPTSTRAEAGSTSSHKSQKPGGYDHRRKDASSGAPNEHGRDGERKAHPAARRGKPSGGGKSGGGGRSGGGKSGGGKPGGGKRFG
jgi:ATP-dependent RNA helicase DeaD